MQRALAISSGGVLQDIATEDRNVLINGDFQISQVGTNFTNVLGGTCISDMWFYQKSGTMVHTAVQDGNVPSIVQAGVMASNSLLVTCTTAQATLGASNFALIRQSIEGYRFQRIAQRPFTLSFWVRASKPGIYCVNFRNSTSDRSFVAEYQINAANTWERKVIYVSASPAAGTWDYGTGTGLRVAWTIAAGSTHVTAANAWTTGSFFATSNQVNGCDTAGNTFALALVQIKPGIIDAPFIKNDIDLELYQCRRYFQASGRADGARLTVPRILQAVSATRLIGEVSFPVPMRAAPTVTIFGNNGGVGAASLYNNSGVDIGNGAVASGIVATGFTWIDFPAGSTFLTSGSFYMTRYSADATLD
jgi:hypothetical protein